MNSQRATEILNSRDIFKVTYQNSSVWIENVNVRENTATIKNLGNDKVSNVPITALQEQ